MTHHNDLHGMGDDFADVLATDRIVDALGRGEDVAELGVEDPLFDLLARARNEADRSIPPAPQISELLGDNDAETPGSTALVAAENTKVKSKRHWKRGASAVAAGGASMTTLLIAGGVAAAIAVGGLGYAAYQNSQPVKSHKITEAGPERNGDDSSSTGAADSSGVGNQESEKAVAPDKADKALATPTPRQRPSEGAAEKSERSNARSSENGKSDSRSEGQQLGDGMNQALEGSRGASLPGYTPPPSGADKMRQRGGDKQSDLGELTQPAVPGGNVPMIGGAPTTTTTAEPTKTTSKSQQPGAAPQPQQAPAQPNTQGSK